MFPNLTVLENLEMGCYLRTDKDGIEEDLEQIFDEFPRLAERRHQAAGTLSGGEQQMLAIGRALMSRPKLVMFDEPSLGLAPNIVERMFAFIKDICRGGHHGADGRAERVCRARDVRLRVSARIRFAGAVGDRQGTHRQPARSGSLPRRLAHEPDRSPAGRRGSGGARGLRRSRGVDASGRGPERSRARADRFVFAQGVRPADEAVPGSLPLLHVRAGAAHRRTRVPLARRGAGDRASRAGRPTARKCCSRSATSPSCATRRLAASSIASAMPTTISYLAEAAQSGPRGDRAAAARESRMSWTPPSLSALRRVSISQGIMLESASARLCEPGGPHLGSPDKDPAARLETIRLAGELRIPFTTGILIGIGETRLERIEALLALRSLHETYGHLQEIIIQNFRPKPGTRMADAPAGIARRAPVDDRGGAAAVSAGDEHPGAAEPERRRAAAARRRRHQRLGRRVAGDAGSRQPGSALAAPAGARAGDEGGGQGAGRAARDLSGATRARRRPGSIRSCRRRCCGRSTPTAGRAPTTGRPGWTRRCRRLPQSRRATRRRQSEHDCAPIVEKAAAGRRLDEAEIVAAVPGARRRVRGGLCGCRRAPARNERRRRSPTSSRATSTTPTSATSSASSARSRRAS